MNTVYNSTLDDTLPERTELNYQYTNKRIKNLLNRKAIPGGKENISAFIITKKNTKVINIFGDNPSNFMVNYILDLYDKDSRVSYEGYAYSKQAAVKKVETDEGISYVCIMYSNETKEGILLLVIVSLGGLALIALALLMFMNELAKELSNVAKEIDFVSSNNKKNDMNDIKIIVQDELAEVKRACNRFQGIKKGNLEMIENNQDLLHFASLGQTTSRMINNVYEPVQTILRENRFLSTTVVTLHDARAKEEINLHSEKIKTEAMYMNEIISAIKGHTTIVSEKDIYPFNITDLFKQVALLTKADFISSRTKLNVENPVNPRVLLYGNMDIMVQILSNILANAINSYAQMEDPHREVKLSAFLDNDKNSIVISIRDYGPGLSKEVEDKLFKEIVKGENGGSGLGLYIAYENIKTHFQGTIDYETSDNGTVFIITIPIYRR